MKSFTYLLHGFVFAFGSPIILYGAVTHLDVLIHPTDVIPPIIFSIVAFFFFVILGYLLTRSLESAGLIATLLVLGFFHLWSVFLAVIVIALVSLLAIRILFKKARNVDTHLVLNAIGVAIVGYYVFRFVTLIGGTPWASAPAVVQPIDRVPETLAAQTTTPDIYYIILDGYGQADMMRALHGFDNSMFVDALEQRGFVVASESQSNYPRTLLSLSSSLNMQYLDTMASAMGDSNLWWPVAEAVQHSEVRRILEGWGYKTVFFATGTDYTNIRDGDYYEAPFRFQLDNFSALLLYQTNLGLLAQIEPLGIADLSYDTHRRLILHKFEQLPEAAKIEGPKFVFAHIIAPHPPYVFDSAGNPLDPPYPYTLAVEAPTGYFDQLQFVNQSILATIDGILANSDSPPIIIIQGDHGPGMRANHNSLDNSCLYERFSILNAYYLPGVDKTSVPMDLAPVNSFRFIFNTYFRGDLELLSNRQYFSTNADFYQFIDVTGQIQEECGSSSRGVP